MPAAGIVEPFGYLPNDLLPDKFIVTLLVNFAGTVISADPSKAIPLIFFVAANLVAVAALPVVFWLSVGNEVRLAALPLGAK